MTYLHAHRVAYQHPSQPSRLFSDITLDLDAGDRLAILGPNGAGKTTLLRLLAGELEPSAGELVRRRGVRLGYVPQESLAPPDEPLLDYVLSARAESDRVRREARALEPFLDDEATALTYAGLIDAYAELGGYALEAEAERVLDGLGFAPIERDLQMGRLSSGQRARAELARLLLAPVDLLFLDEPTNHLDVAARAWLERYMADLDAAVAFVSHDRAFITRMANRVLELRRGEARLYEGGYDFFRAQRSHLERQAWEAYEGQQRRHAAAERAAEKRLVLADKVETIPPGQRIRSGKPFYAAMAGRIARTARVIRERSLREPPVYKPRLDDPIPTLTFPNVKRASDVVFQLEGLGKAHGDRWLFEGLTLEVYRGERLAVTGPNGAGKTTLLRVLLGEEPPTAGRLGRGANVKVAYYAQEREELDAAASALDQCMALHPDETWVRTLLACLRLRGEAALRPVGTMSAGEQGKVALVRLLLSGANVLVLDEPTNHLDLDAREALEGTLAQFPGAIVFVSHDEAFVEALADRVLELGS
jgi:ATP-binding cassette subfamily F protein 3